MSLGHFDPDAVVIIAQIEWPCEPLKVVCERISDGLRFSAARSTKGNGTTTTSPKSQITKRLFVLRRIPFRECVGQSIQIRVSRSHFADFDNLAPSQLKSLPNLAHRPDRLDPGGRAAVAPFAHFFPPAHDAVDFQFDNFTGDQRRYAVLEGFAALDLLSPHRIIANFDVSHERARVIILFCSSYGWGGGGVKVLNSI